MNDWVRIEENEISFFSIWAEAEERDYGVLLHNPRFADDPLFNHAAGVRPSPVSQAGEIVQDVTRFYRSEGIPPCVFVTPMSSPQDLKPSLGGAGYIHEDDLIVMKRSGTVEAPAEGGLKVVVVDEDGLEDWKGVFVDAFGIPPGWEPELSARCRRLLNDPRNVLYLGLLSGSPVATLCLHSQKGIGGIYCVGTLRKHRNRGIASYLVERAIGESNRLGNSYVCLQVLKSEGYQRFYGQLGFIKEYEEEIHRLRS